MSVLGLDWVGLMKVGFGLVCMGGLGLILDWFWVLIFVELVLMFGIELGVCVMMCDCLVELVVCYFDWVVVLKV